MNSGRAGRTCFNVQNGVDASERLIAVFGPGPVLGGTCHVVSLVVGPGQVEQRSEFRKITLGELDGRLTERVKAIGEALERAGAQVEVSEDINKARWTKFVFIASFSGVGAAARVPAGEMMACAETRVTLEAAMREVEALAAAHGVTLEADVPVPVHTFLYSVLLPQERRARGS